MKLIELKSACIALTGLALCFSLPSQSIADSDGSPQKSMAVVGSPLKTIDPLIPPARGIIELVRQEPKSVERLISGVVLIDYGRVAFGNLELPIPADFEGTFKVRFGEKLQDGVIDRSPPGNVRYSEVEVNASPNKTMVIAPPTNKKNTRQPKKPRRIGSKFTPPAVLTPAEWDVVMPFRWIEIEGLPAEYIPQKTVRRAAFPKHWDNNSASFACSDETLNRVWDLCRYSIKATMFAGVYVDGDRERIPYEADAYLNQLSHYYVDHDPSMARDTFDWLIQNPTWPTEWAPHMVFMAYADWMQNGDKEWISQRYESLKSKTLMDRCGDSGLVQSNAKQMDWNDIVDWPPVERDGYVRSEVNTVVNAFHYAAITKMAELAEVVGAYDDAEQYRNHAQQVKRIFNQELFDTNKRLYRDGADVDHYSLHANFFSLAFGLVEKPNCQHIVNWLEKRGMRCSTYASQYLLESLFEQGADQAAVELMIAPGDRSWRHMLDSDATITWESWNEIVKTNIDWNHAWGAAPANLLPRFVLGVQPLAAGWDHAKIRPCPSGLEFARGVVPTPRGPISIDWNRKNSFSLKLKLSEGIAASVQVPTMPGAAGVFVNGQLVEADLVNGYWILKEDLRGEASIEVQ